MTNTKAINAVNTLALEGRFFTSTTVQMNLVSKNPEDIYDLMGNDFDVCRTTNLRTGKEIEFEVVWSEIESVALVSVPNEEEIYIDPFEDVCNGIKLIDSPSLPVNRKLFEIGCYELLECKMDDRLIYCLVNKETNQTYELHLELCFSLVTKYLDEQLRYILLDDLKELEQQAVK